MILKYFGNIQAYESRPIIRKEISLNGKDVTLSLILSEDKPEDNHVNPSLDFTLENLDTYEDLITNIIRQYKYTKDSGWGRNIYYYAGYHAADLSADEVLDLLDDYDEILPVESKLVDVLYVHSIDFSKDSICWNFTISDYLSNYLLEVKTNYKLSIKSIKTKRLL